jgi:hypothetical protein
MHQQKSSVCHNLLAMSKYRNQTQTDEGVGIATAVEQPCAPKQSMPRHQTRPSLPTTGSQDTQQNEQDDNMSDNGSFGASDDSELAQWEVLEADEGDNYIDPFYGGEDDDASV